MLVQVVLPPLLQVAMATLLLAAYLGIERIARRACRPTVAHGGRQCACQPASASIQIDFQSGKKVLKSFDEGEVLMFCYQAVQSERNYPPISNRNEPDDSLTRIGFLQNVDSTVNMPIWVHS